MKKKEKLNSSKLILLSDCSYFGKKKKRNMLSMGRFFCFKYRVTIISILVSD